VGDFIWKAFPDLAVLKKSISLFEQGAGSHPDYAEFYARGEYTIEQRISGFLESMKLDQKILERTMSTLSGGEALRVALVSVLSLSPDMMILDEPAGGLDIKGRTWFRDFLENTSIPFLVISHDREILGTCNRI
jgi:ATPase subunit of ABC transporter with duplicated ATPase domains